eukprot:TRINITY_DN1668_c0_g2_i7.p1 TRINITY_DN1668_c0_g2~~TRINITY_DN1668_c0_g2_i7.p1  ORF type:complete len:217 (+),score=25.27 TRINITY_DN1668_c0_g2_i7:76-726(+)
MGVVWSSNYTLTVAERAEEKVFFTACEHGNLKLVEECLRNTPRLALAEDKLTANATGLHWASLYSLGDSIGVIDALLKAGAAVEAVDSDQRQTPLHLAAGNGRLDAVLALLAAGAERHAMNKHGVTPVDKARAAHQTAVINAFETVQRPPPQLSHPEQVRVESTVSALWLPVHRPGCCSTPDHGSRLLPMTVSAAASGQLGSASAATSGARGRGAG